MPRPRRATPDRRGNSVVASGARVHPRTVHGVRSTTRGLGGGWQDEAWQMFDEVGELAECAQWVANALSKCILRLQWYNDDGEWVVDDPEQIGDDTPLVAEARTALADLFGGSDGQRDMMATFGLHFTIPGETFLVGISDPGGAGDEWLALSGEELIPDGVQWKIDRGDGDVRVYVDAGEPSADPEAPSAVVIRLWRPHPRRHYLATSPTRAAIPVLRKIIGLNRFEGSTLDSRAAGNGILLMPSEATFVNPDPTVQPLGDGQTTGDPLMDTLIATGTAAITNPGSASARFPVLARMPGEYIPAVQHIQFDYPLSEHLTEREDAAIRRLALAMDAPPEVILGQGDSNHWSAWLISEDGIKVHVEPLGGVLVSALNSEYLYVRLLNGATPTDPTAAQRVADARRWRFILDTSELRQRPNRTQEAQALWANNLISDDAVRRETGFSDEDKPDDDEIGRRLLIKVAAGNPGPDLVSGALQALGVQVTPDPTAAERVTAPGTPVAIAPTPPVEVPRNPPSPDQAAALLASAELMVLRAMERAQNRVVGRGARRDPVRGVPVEQMEVCLRDAWKYAPRVAALTGVDPTRLTEVCDTYARRLLATGGPHQPEELADRLRTHVLAAADGR